MDKSELRKKWVEALRSPDYKKTKYRLCRGNGYYCCLGVAAEVAGEKFENDDWNGWFIQEGHLICDNFLPKRVVQAYGLRYGGGELSKLIRSAGHTYSSLSQLNDQAGWSFGRIANLIENQPELVFED